MLSLFFSLSHFFFFYIYLTKYMSQYKTFIQYEERKEREAHSKLKGSVVSEGRMLITRPFCRLPWKIALRTMSPSLPFFLAFDFCRFCVVIDIFMPATTTNDLGLQKDFHPRFLSITFFVLSRFLRARNSLLNVECQTRALLVPFL